MRPYCGRESPKVSRFTVFFFSDKGLKPYTRYPVTVAVRLQNVHLYTYTVCTINTLSQRVETHTKWTAKAYYIISTLTHIIYMFIIMIGRYFSVVKFYVLPKYFMMYHFCSFVFYNLLRGKYLSCD